MNEDQGPANLDELLDSLQEAADKEDPVTVETMLDKVGTRSFGPIVLLAGLIILAPLIGDIPGVPTIMATIVLLTTGQLLFRRDHIWLPDWILRRSAERKKLQKGIDWMRKPARVVDRIIRPRLKPFASGVALYVIAAVCVMIAAVTPAMEFVPFSANGAGLALTAFGLALIAHDGLLALIAFAATAATFGFVGYHLLG